MVNHPHRATASRKIIATWSWDVKVGIYDNCTVTVRLYEDRAVHREPYVRWIGNTGGYAERTNRIEGRMHAQLLRIAARQVEDESDYTDRVAEIVHEAAYA